MPEPLVAPSFSQFETMGRKHQGARLPTSIGLAYIYIASTGDL